MSRLLGFVRSGIDPQTGVPYCPEDPANYWIWQATDFPPYPQWDYERLQIQTLPASDGNVLIRVLGPYTDRCRDGVFLQMHMNAEHRPRVKLDSEMDPVLQNSWEEALARIHPIAPNAGVD